MLRSCISAASSSSSLLRRSVMVRRSVATLSLSRSHPHPSTSSIGNGIAGRTGECSARALIRNASFTSTSASASRHAAASREAYYKKRNQSLLLYSAAVLALMGGITYAAVPLYRIFCSQTGYGGVPMTGNSLGDAEFGLGRFAKEKLVPFLGDDTRKERKIRVTFNADCSDALPWKFTPLQRDVKVRPGESALAFYTATNKSDKDIIGIATYNVTPNNVGDLCCATFAERLTRWASTARYRSRRTLPK